MNTYSSDDDPRCEGTIDSSKISGEPGGLSIHNRVEWSRIFVLGTTRLIGRDETMTKVSLGVELDIVNL